MPEKLKALPETTVRSPHRTETRKKGMAVKGGDGPSVTSGGLLVDLRGNGINSPSIAGLTIESLVPKDDKPQEIGMGSLIGTCTLGMCGDSCGCPPPSAPNC